MITDEGHGIGPLPVHRRQSNRRRRRDQIQLWRRREHRQARRNLSGKLLAKVFDQAGPAPAEVEEGLVRKTDLHAPHRICFVMGSMSIFVAQLCTKE